MDNKPLVTVIVANYNNEKYLNKSLQSVLNQSIKNIEVILIDDNSTDNSRDIAFDLAANDPRLRIVCLDKNMGPSYARNKALEISHGEWISVLDSDDFMRQDRIKTLIQMATEYNADIIADDLLVFSDSGSILSHKYLGEKFDTLQWISVTEFIKSNSFHISDTPGYGVLKPIIRREAIQKNNTRYDESLINSEDYDFIVRLMLGGSNYLISSYQGYYYRKHDQSISHRIDSIMLEEMLESDRKIKSLIPSTDIDLYRAANIRHQSIKNILSFQKIVESIKKRHLVGAVIELIKNPRSIYFFYIPIRDKMREFQKIIFTHEKSYQESTSINTLERHEELSSRNFYSLKHK